MDDIDEVRYCFRCRGMAVIDPTALNHLPSLLNKAAILLDINTPRDAYEYSVMKQTLREYAILLDSVLQDG